MAKTAIKCGKLFDSAKGEVLQNMVILVEGDKIAEVLVGKASVEVTAPADGTIHIKAEESEIVSGDDVIAEIE